MTEPVPLESIEACFRGVIPSILATSSADGTPNVTYMSIVQYVDSERIALSRQFFNKTRANLDANPSSQLRVVDPETLDQYELDLEYIGTESQGPTFETMRANLEAVASQTGMGNVFRLRGVDIHRVICCDAVGETPTPRPPRAQGDVLIQLEELTRRLSEAQDYDEMTRRALEALHDLFGFDHSILLVRDPSQDRLFATATNGYGGASVGAEVADGEGVIGIASTTGEVVCVSNLLRSRVMNTAVRGGLSGQANSPGPDIPLPGLPDARSIAAVPLTAGGEVRGALYLESDRTGAFGPHNERLLRVLGRHLAVSLRSFDGETPTSPAPAKHSVMPASTDAEPIRVAYYQADDSVFAGDEYVVKGVPGRILWRLLCDHASSGRTTFTNRELRLDESLGLPAGAENLEARLLVLRKRLAGADFGIGLERVGRGRLALRVDRPLELSEVPTGGPMRAAHQPADPHEGA